MICSIDKVIKTLVPLICVHCRNKSTFVNNLVLSGKKGGGRVKRMLFFNSITTTPWQFFFKWSPMAVQSDGRNFIEETGKRRMVLMINRSSVKFICNRLYIYLHSYEIRLTSKYYIWTNKFAFVYCVINSCTFQN